jgi:phage portal protein BeeE
VIHDGTGANIIGYLYTAGGGQANEKSVVIPVDEMAHYYPIPDPQHPHMGMSWLTPVARQVNNHVSMAKYQSDFFRNAATPNLLMKIAGKLTEQQRERLDQQIETRHTGSGNAYKTMVIEGGADVEVIGRDLREIQFTMTRAATENEIAAAAGVPAILAGLKEGLQAATYSNAAQARRVMAMGTGRFLLQQSAEALRPISDPPRPSSELWYDERLISWFNEEATEAAQILETKANTMETLIRAGYMQDEVAGAVASGDLTNLPHSGLVSVQLVTPGGVESVDAVEPIDELGDIDEGDDDDNIDG